MSSSRSRPPASNLMQQLEIATKLLNLSKIMVGFLVALVLWAANLQRDVADLKTVVAEIQRDRRERIKDADAWRVETDKANITRDQQLKQLTKIAEAQAERPAVGRNR